MRSLTHYFIALLMLVSVAGPAQPRQFATTRDAVKYINEICNKFWLKDQVEGEVSREITVYQHGFQLFFNERSILKGTDPANPEGNEVFTKLTSVNLEQAKETGNKNAIEFTGKDKDIVTVSYQGNAVLESKGEFSRSYRLPLDYNNRALHENMLTLCDAVDFLLKECYAKACRIKN